MFHVQPLTGDVGRCQARVRCPFGDETEHYESKSEARAAYEQRMTSFAVNAHDQSFTTQRREQARALAQELVAEISTDQGTFGMPDEPELRWHTGPNGEDVESFVEEQWGQFRLFACGAEVNAYQAGDLVLKLPHFNSVGDFWHEGTSEILSGLRNAERRVYENLDHARLAQAGVSYVPTYYFTLPTSSGPLPVMAQPYLAPEEYESVSLPNPLQKQLGELGVWDFNAGNVRRHRGTGALVLIDCIPAW